MSGECDNCGEHAIDCVCTRDLLLSAFNKMNLNINSKERKAFNKFRSKLWYSADLLSDLCQSPSCDNDFRNVEGKKIYDLVTSIPILEK
jgi:hypothetical protein